MIAVLLLLVVLFLISVILYYEIFNHSIQLMKKIPGPKRWPIVGNSLNLFKPPHKLFYYLQDLYKEYGAIVQIHAINFKAVQFSDAEYLEKILSSPEYNEKRDPYTYLQPWLGEGLLLSNGDKWHHRRKLLTKAFHFNILRKYLLSINDCVQQFIDCIQDELNQTKTSLTPMLGLVSLRIMCESTLNVSIDKLPPSQREKYRNSIHTMGQCVFHRCTNIWLSIGAIFRLTKLFKMQKIALKYLHEFTNNIIDERRKKLKEIDIIDSSDGVSSSNEENCKRKPALLDLLLSYEDSGVVNNNDIREEVDTFMFRGHDSIAVTLTLLLMRIANESDVQYNLVKELKQIFGESTRSPTMEDLKEMRYIECCIKESLRIYPTVPLIMRHLLKDTVFGKYTVPANTIAFLNIFGIHHSSNYFPEPEKFIPERFLIENSNSINPFSYVPFSAGPRNCIGQKFAMMEMKSIVSGVFRKYRLEPVTKPSEIKFTTDIILRPNHPIYVRFRKRD